MSAIVKAFNLVGESPQNAMLTTKVYRRVFMRIALSIQLTLYALAWLLIGLAFGLGRQAVMAWSLAWGILAAVTGALANPQWFAAPAILLVMNTAVVLAFASLLWGCTKAYREPVNPMHAVVPLLGATLVDVMRYEWFAETTTVRLIGFVRLSALVWLPGLMVVYFFSLRAYWLSENVVPATESFTGQSALDQVAITLFLISLGSFNFAQAVFVIGRMARRLTELSETDQLTRLANRRTLMRQMTAEDARLRRTGRDNAVLMMDLEHFKKLNDTHGHQAGDLALKEVADAVKSVIRANDLLARYGGEEFLLLSPETNLEAALVLGNRIRERIMTLSIATGAHTVKVTASIGIAMSAMDETHFEKVIKRADDALYQAKARGRNCVVVSKLEPPRDDHEL